MTSLAAVQVDCPVCGDTIDVPITATAETVDRETNTAAITVTPDLDPINEHAAEHREA